MALRNLDNELEPIMRSDVSYVVYAAVLFTVVVNEDNKTHISQLNVP
jgi:hypothetical protein